MTGPFVRQRSPLRFVPPLPMLQSGRRLRVSPLRDASRARVLTFSAPERAVVADFLRNSTGWSSYPEAYKAAVYDFWDPRTAGAARASVEADIREAFVGVEVRPEAPLIRTTPGA